MMLYVEEYITTQFTHICLANEAIDGWNVTTAIIQLRQLEVTIARFSLHNEKQDWTFAQSGFCICFTFIVLSSNLF